jgi:Kef-type K+ transport system membrane component KefB
MNFLFAAAAPGALPPGLLSLGQLFAGLITIYLASKFGGELALRMQQPAVLGELIAGLVVGTSGFHLIDPSQPVLLLLGQVGVTLLLFEIGLESDLRGLLKVGVQSFVVGIAGMILPGLLGYGVMKLVGAADLVAIFVGASMTATSIGISAKVLSELDYLHREEGKIILGAAVFDDILGIVVLSVISGIAGGSSLEWVAILQIVAISLGFLVGAIVIGNRFIPFFLKTVNVLRTRGELLIASLIFAFSLSYIAEQVGSAAIIGAFAAGLVLAETDKRHELEEQLRPVTDFFLPIFFIMVGAGVNLALLLDIKALSLSLALSFVAVLGKLVCGYFVIGKPVNRLVIGAGMVPRGEVGLVFASVGLSAGILVGANHTAVVIMVIMTTFVGPLLLARLLKKQNPLSLQKGD